MSLLKNDFRRIEKTSILKLVDENLLDMWHRYMVVKPSINLDRVDISRLSHERDVVIYTDSAAIAMEVANQFPTELLFDLHLK